MERFPWWEATVLIRKLLLQALVVFVSDNYVQTATASWILVAAMALQFVWSPYSSPELNRLDGGVMVVLTATQMLSAFYYTMDQVGCHL